MLIRTHRQESLSRAYIQAIASRCGLNCSFREFDYGIDVTVQVKLESNVAGTQLAGGGHLGNAGNTSKWSNFLAPAALTGVSLIDPVVG